VEVFFVYVGLHFLEPWSQIVKGKEREERERRETRRRRRRRRRKKILFVFRVDTVGPFHSLLAKLDNQTR
jgi:hypothetical protein